MAPKALSICGGEQYKKACASQGSKPIDLFFGEFRCILNRKNPLARKERISLEELRDLIYITTNIKGRTEDNCSTAQMYRPLFHLIPPHHIMEVGFHANVMELLCKTPEAFTLGYYPIILGWKEIQMNQLVTIPLENPYAVCPTRLFYAAEAYRTHREVRELVKEIKSSAARFMSEAGEE